MTIIKPTYHLMILLLVYCAPLIVTGQSVIFIDDRDALDKYRYADVKGSPYFFKEWPDGTLYDINLEEIKGLKVNLNGYTGLLEVMKGDKTIELEPKLIARVKVSPDQGGAVITQGRQFQSDFPFVISHYEDDVYQLVEEFFVKMGEKDFNNYGENRTVQRFQPYSQYVLVIDGLRNDLKLKKKDFLKLIRESKEAEAFIKNNKLKMKDIRDYATVLENIKSD